MKSSLLLLFLLSFTIFHPQGATASSADQGTTIKATDGLYEFTLKGKWEEIKNPGPKIEKMFVTADKLGRFFILRIPNPPDSEIKEAQLNAYIEGLKNRYLNFKVIEKKVLNKHNNSMGTVIFTYDAKTPQGPLKIHNYCEVMIHKKNYLNVCGVAPVAEWGKKKQEILEVFQSWKFI